MLLTGTSFLARTHASTKQQVRDSIFQAAAAIPNDSIRCAFLRDAFQQYIGQESATEYLDSAIELSHRKRYIQKNCGHSSIIAANMNISLTLLISKRDS